MSQGYLLVSFSGGSRRVIANGDDVGQTGAVLGLDIDEYIIRLSGSGYAPDSQTVLLTGTSVDHPKKVHFLAVAATSPSPPAAPPAAAPAP